MLITFIDPVRVERPELRGVTAAAARAGRVAPAVTAVALWR
jgi:hypothetical protein